MAATFRPDSRPGGRLFAPGGAALCGETSAALEAKQDAAELGGGSCGETSAALEAEEDAAEPGGGSCGETSAALEAEEDAAEPVALGRQRRVGEPAEGDGREQDAVDL